MIDDRTPADHEHERWQERRDDERFNLRRSAILRDELLDEAQRQADLPIMCSHCHVLFAKRDQCGCGLCPQSCEMLCHPIYDSGSGIMRSNCGNCS